MSDFVNYHKRSVTLPEGCKDLTDLFDPPSPPAADPPLPPDTQVFNFKTKTLPFELTRDQSGPVTLDQIEPLLERAYQSQAPVCGLTLSASVDETVDWSLMRVRLPSIEAFHGCLNIGRASAERMDTAGRVFTAHGLAPRLSRNYSYCKPEIPPEILYTIDPMPPDAAACAKLVQDLFHELAHGGTEAPLKFTYRELKRKG